MNWDIVLARRARKALKRLPPTDQMRILAAIDAMRGNPLAGDVVHLTHDPRAAFRRRIGDYRIFFDMFPERRLIEVVTIERRTSSTY